MLCVVKEKFIGYKGKVTQGLANINCKVQAFVELKSQASVSVVLYGVTLLFILFLMVHMSFMVSAKELEDSSVVSKDFVTQEQGLFNRMHFLGGSLGLPTVANVKIVEGKGFLLEEDLPLVTVKTLINTPKSVKEDNQLILSDKAKNSLYSYMSYYLIDKEVLSEDMAKVVDSFANLDVSEDNNVITAFNAMKLKALSVENTNIVGNKDEFESNFGINTSDLSSTNKETLEHIFKSVLDKNGVIGIHQNNKLSMGSNSYTIIYGRTDEGYKVAGCNLSGKIFGEALENMVYSWDVLYSTLLNQSKPTCNIIYVWKTDNSVSPVLPETTEDLTKEIADSEPVEEKVEVGVATEESVPVDESVPRYSNFPKYNLSDDTIRYIAGVIMGECYGTKEGCEQEASQMANLNESRGRSTDDAGIRKTVKPFSQGGWYADRSFTVAPTQTAIDAVISVMVEGKRVLPRYVVEHDMFPLDAAISGNWYNGSGEDRSQYIPHETIIKQNPNRFSGAASYTFYCFFDGGKGDVAGYYKNDWYEQYKDDVPYTEGAIPMSE